MDGAREPRQAGGDRRPVVAVSMGDPLGIGPEVVVRAIADPEMQALARFTVYGSEGPLRTAAEAAGVEWRWKVEGGRGEAGGGGGAVLVECGGGVEVSGPPRPTAEGGRMSEFALRRGLEAVVRGEADALVTAPISKESWDLAAVGFPGHTELLADALGVKGEGGKAGVGMLFVGPTLRVILATIHMALRDVPRALTVERVLGAIELGAQACVEMGVRSPRVAVAGLNPHAGEGGLFGDEDERVIRPAVERARAAGIDATGPWPGDSVFLAAAGGKHDLVVAMYHDQGLIPVKLLDREEAVNVTVGLPIIRTSPAHGTAFDIAGRGVASAASMKAAVRVAVGMVGARDLSV